MNTKIVSSPAFFDTVKSRLTELLLKNKHHTKHLILKHNTTYIFPSKAGLGFLFVTLLNFILGINYQNNLVLVMAYLMLVVMVFSLLTAYSNAQGLQVKYQNLTASYSPAPPLLNLQLKAASSSQAFSFIYDNIAVATIDEITTEPKILQLPLPISQRGEYKPTLLKVLSQYPFGLVSVWSYMQLSESFYVYPKKLKPQHLPGSTSDARSASVGTYKQTNGIDEFDSLKVHQTGMNINRVSWKHYAKTQQLMIKEFINLNEQSTLYDFNQLQGDTESRLSQLSFLISEGREQKSRFSLVLADTYFSAPNDDLTMDQHYTDCLKAISRFNKTTESLDANNA